MAFGVVMDKWRWKLFICRIVLAIISLQRIFLFLLLHLFHWRNAQFAHITLRVCNPFSWMLSAYVWSFKIGIAGACKMCLYLLVSFPFFSLSTLIFPGYFYLTFFAATHPLSCPLAWWKMIFIFMIEKKNNEKGK